MVYEFLIDGVDRAGSLDRDSFGWKTNSRGKPDEIMCTMESRDEDYSIDISQEVVFFIDSVKKFHGKIVDVEPVRVGVDRRRWNIACQDHTEEARQGSMIAEIYKNMTVKEILDDMFSRYPHLLGFSTAGVVCDEIIDYVFFGYKKTHECIKTLSERVGYDFYFDEHKTLHFFLPETNIAPFSISEKNGKAINESLKFSKSLSGIINSILVEGADYVGNNLSSEPLQIADGVAVEYALSGAYSQLKVFVNSVEQSVGAFGLHEPADYDCLYDYDSRKVVFREDNKPSNGENLEISGFLKIPIFIQKTEMSSISKYGERPHKPPKDESLKTLESAKQYATAEIVKHATEQYAGSFSTYEVGLRAGQRIQVSDSFLGISESFSIASTNTRMMGDDIFATNVSLSNAEVIDTAGLLSRMINRESSTATTSDILRIFRDALERVKIKETVSVNLNNKRSDERVHLVETTTPKENETIDTYVYGDAEPDFNSTIRNALYNSSYYQ